MTTILAVDPGLVTGVALIQADERWEPTLLGHWTLELGKVVPVPARDLERGCCDIRRALYGVPPEVHWVSERQFVLQRGGEAHPGSLQESTALMVTRIDGQLYQELTNPETVLSVAWPMASEWRRIVQTGQWLTSDEAHARCIARVEAQFGETLPEHEAEATCMALWRLEQLRKEAVAARIAEAAGTQRTLPIDKQARRGKSKRGLEGLPTEVQAAAKRAQKEVANRER